MTILDAGDKALLECMGDVGAVGERPVASGSLEQLHRGLAVAVLQILLGKAVSMGG